MVLHVHGTSMYIVHEMGIDESWNCYGFPSIVDLFVLLKEGCSYREGRGCIFTEEIHKHLFVLGYSYPVMQEVAAWPIFVHPVQNFSVVRFDPSTVKGSFDAAVLSSRETEHSEQQSFLFDSHRQSQPPPSPGPLRQQAQSASKSDAGAEWRHTNGRSGVIEDTKDVCEADNLSIPGKVSNGHDGDAISGNANGVHPVQPVVGNEGREYCDDVPAVKAEALPVGHENGTVASSPAAGDPAITRDFSPPPLRPGDGAEFHGLTSANAPVRQRTVVVKLERLSLASSVHPQFTAHNVEVRLLWCEGKSRERFRRMFC